MSQLFISHSSRDNPLSLGLRDWLREQGWSLFLDLDPEHGIQIGEQWRKTLRHAIHECEGMILLLSEHWLNSQHCLAEYQLAEACNKPLFPLLIAPLDQQQIPHAILDKWNIGQLTSGYPQLTRTVTLPDGEQVEIAFSETGLNRLKRGLTHAGLHPDSFHWPPLSQYRYPPSPYKGLKPLEQEDAGILFGRDGAIKSFIAELQRLRQTTRIRLMVIQGASGAGKSSFLRAGILPRLARYPQQFALLPVIRPHDAVLSGEKGLIDALVQSNDQLKLGYHKTQIHQMIHTLYDETAQALDPQALRACETFLSTLIHASDLPFVSQSLHHSPLRQKTQKNAHLQHNTEDRKLPTLVIPLDQAEELFIEQQTQAQPFLQLIASLIRSEQLDILLLCTIRTDAYAALQAATPLEGLDQYPFSLPRIAKGAYQQIIEGPAKLLDKTHKPLWIDPQLTDRLLKDLEQDGGKDALPLLAFTLERLYLDYGHDGKIELKEYLTFQDDTTQQHSGLGGLQGAVNIAIEEALRNARKDPRIPQDQQACMALLRRAFIPALASIDIKTHRPHRKVAHYETIPEDVRPLIDCLVESRLLTKDYHAPRLTSQDGILPSQQAKQGITIELAHESILRQWHVLSDWLKEDMADLSLLEMLQVESSAWMKAKGDPEWLRLRGGRLQDAERLQQGKFNAYIQGELQQYLQACRQQEQKQHADELKKAQALAQAKANALVRTKIGLAFSFGLLYLSIMVGSFAFDKKQEAEQQTQKYQTELNKSNILLQEIGYTIRLLNVEVRDVLEQYVPTNKQTDIYAQIEQLRQRLEHYGDLHQDLRQIATAYVNQGTYHGDLGHLGDLDKAREYYERAFQELEQLVKQAPDNPKAQLDLSLAYEKLGNIAEMQHNVKLALKHYQAAFHIRKQLVNASPNDPLTQHYLSLAYKKIGDIYYLRQRTQFAQEHYQAALNIDKALLKQFPQQDKYQRELSISYHNFGKILLREHQYTKALDYYQLAFSLSQQWAKQDPTNQKAQQNLSVAYERLGDVHQAQGSLPEAVDYYQKAIDLDKQQIKQDPHNQRLQYNLGVAYEKIARVIHQQQQPNEAEDYYQAAFDIFQQLAQASPKNRQTQRNLAISYGKLGNVAFSQKQMKQANLYYQQAFQLFEELVKQSPKNKYLQRLLSVAHNKLGNVALAQKAYGEALHHYQTSFMIRYKLYLTRMDNQQAKRDLASSYEHLGDIAKQQHNYTLADYHYQQALQLSDHLLTQQPENVLLVENIAYLHQKLAQVAQQLKNQRSQQYHQQAYQNHYTQFKLKKAQAQQSTYRETNKQPELKKNSKAPK
ncbi:tetratricopeptide repeat protein [Pasteurella sp. PK-2025]|uniref:nSTAND1 domain-containing NTPase n=1 Tax=Pasteurella sp. PK-2025 TaxID=3413133 RepID=UPI003C717BDB